MGGLVVKLVVDHPQFYVASFSMKKLFFLYHFMLITLIIFSGVRFVVTTRIGVVVLLTDTFQSGVTLVG